MSTHRERELAAEHRPRTLKAGSEREPRISRADEQVFADREHERRDTERRERAVEEAERAREIDRRLVRVLSALDELRTTIGPLARADYRDFDRIRLRLGHIKRRHVPAD